MGLEVNDMKNDCCQKTTKRTEEQRKAIDTRINKIIGQLNGVKKMVESDRYCEDILIQLSAIDKSVKSLANVVLNHHLHNCIVSSIRNGDESVVEEISDIFKRFN